MIEYKELSMEIIILENSDIITDSNSPIETPEVPIGGGN